MNSWSKRLERHERIQKLRDLFDAQCLEFTEDNLPTNVQTFFEDVLAALPEGSRTFEVEKLFKSAAKNWRQENG